MKQILGKYRLFCQIAVLLLLHQSVAVAQVTAPAPVRDSISPALLDSLRANAGLRTDSLPPARRDSAVVDLSKVRLSDNGLDGVVDYGARDSMWFDVKNKQLHLYGNAFLNYTSIKLKADYILLDYAKNEVSAEPGTDSLGRQTGLPEFQDGEQNFTAGKLRYNFKTRKGIIYEARTKQEDLYVLGAKAKFIGAAVTDDTLSKVRNTIYNQDAIITTCDAEHPHYGFRTRKLKVIPDKLVVTSLSSLEVGGVPTPLVIPFGFFPITKTQKAGLIIPRDFEFADQEGLGLRDFGWYQPISPYFDSQILFNAYTSGSWGLNGNVRYKRRYFYEGNFQIRRNVRVTENNQAQKLRAKSFGITWTHNQAANSHPTRKFNGSVNIETNRDQNRNFNDFNRVYQNTLTSSISYTQTFPGKPFSLTAGMQHSQNTQTRAMNITFPTATFTVQRIFPFKRKNPVGKERWYEKISLQNTSTLRNEFRTVDTLLFTQQTLNSARMGIQHKANSDFNFKIFKYINVSPNISYEENWYPYVIEKDLLDQYVVKRDTFNDNGELIITTDTLQYGVDTTRRQWGFNTFRSFNAGVSMNTALFLTQRYKHGWLRGIRHTFKPSASIGFGPDFTNSRYDRYFKFVDTDLRPDKNKPQRYGIFDENLFGKPSYSKRDVSVSYSFSNVLEIKHRSKQDTTGKGKNTRIFDNLTFTGSYSLTADSLNWSPISTGGVFRFFKGLVTLNWRTQFDPYVVNEKGVRINKTTLQENGKLVRVSNFGFDVTTGFTIGQMRSLFSGQDDQQAGGAKSKFQATSASPPTDDFLGWFNSFNISYNIGYVRSLVPGTARDTFRINSHSLRLSGSIPLTSKWSLSIRNVTYDFPSKSLVYPDFGLTRDLHCWEMSVFFQPDRGTYNFYIAVKPGSLDFLKVPYKKNNVDALYKF